jgi:hypothetical protein
LDKKSTWINRAQIPGQRVPGGGFAANDVALCHAGQKFALYWGDKGKKLLVLCGEKKAIAMAVKNDSVSRRNTGLAERLRK